MAEKKKMKDTPRKATLHWAMVLQMSLGALAFAWSAHSLLEAEFPTLLALGLSTLLVMGFGRFSLRLPGSQICLSLSEPLVFSVMLWGGPGPAALLAGLDGFLASTRHARARHLRLANGSVMTLSVLAGGAALEYLSPGSLRQQIPVEHMIAPVFAAALTSYVVNILIYMVVNALHKGFETLRQTQALFSWTILSNFASASAALLIWAVYTQYGALALALGVPATVIVYMLFWSVVERSDSQQKHHDELKLLHTSMMEAFALAIDSRDHEARGHARRVQAYAEALGSFVAQHARDFSIGYALDDAWCESLSTSALLHDVGKLSVPDQLLQRTDDLSPAERDRLREHATLGAAIIGRIPFPHPIAAAVRHHHENWDGSGYPEQLRGEAISLEARIVGLADQLDHVHQSHGSDSAPSVENLVAFVARYSGTRFDPKLAELYCAHAEEIEEIVSQRGDLRDERSRRWETSQDTETLRGLGEAQREAGVLYGLARELGTTLDVQESCALVVERLLDLLPATSCAIYLADSKRQILVPHHAKGPLRGILSERSFAPGEGITGWTFEVGDAALNADPRVDLGWDAEQESAPTRCQLAVPIRDDEGTLGVITFYAPQANVFENDHLRILDSAIPQAAHALRNAALYESTRRTSMTDSLTGLPNSRYLYAQLEKEVARATRRAMPLVVVVMDLDGFKPINDTWGHQAGDEVLAKVAKMFQDTFRQGDIVCRYAGDEFVALLPETSPEEARTVVERVQHHIQETAIEVPSGNERAMISVGCSAGLSCFPLDGSTLEELIHRADKEMYRDKALRHEELEIEGRR